MGGYLRGAYTKGAYKIILDIKKTLIKTSYSHKEFLYEHLINYYQKYECLW